MATLGNGDTGSAATGTTIDMSLTVQSADDLLVAGVGLDFDAEVTSVVIDPGGGDEASFTLGKKERHVSVGSAEIWYLLEASIPAAGTYTVRVTKTVSGQGGAAYVQAMQGMVQEAPNQIGGQTESVGSPSDWDINLPSVTADSYVFDLFHMDDAGRSGVPDGSQVELLDLSADGTECGSYLADVSGSVDVGWTPNGGDAGVYAAAAFAVDAGGGGGIPVPVALAHHRHHNRAA